MASPESRPHYGAGVAASLTAEAVFVAVVAAIALLRGNDPWMVARVPATLLLGPTAVQPTGFVPDKVLLGLLLHLWLSVLVGLVYAALLPRVGLPPVAGGLVTGAILYALGFWALPILFPSWLAPFWLLPTGRLLQALAHAVYGVVLGAAYSRLRRPPPR